MTTRRRPTSRSRWMTSMRSTRGSWSGARDRLSAARRGVGSPPLHASRAKRDDRERALPSLRLAAVVFLGCREARAPSEHRWRCGSTVRHSSSPLVGPTRRYTPVSGCGRPRRHGQRSCGSSLRYGARPVTARLLCGRSSGAGGNPPPRLLSSESERGDGMVFSPPAGWSLRQPNRSRRRTSLLRAALATMRTD